MIQALILEKKKPASSIHKVKFTEAQVKLKVKFLGRKPGVHLQHNVLCIMMDCYKTNLNQSDHISQSKQREKYKESIETGRKFTFKICLKYEKKP